MIDTYYNFRIPYLSALLTDFHNSDPAPVLKSLKANKPKLILIAGDLIYGDDPDENGSNIYKNGNGLELLQACVKIAPTFMSLGNHEWMLTTDEIGIIGETGVTVLDNTWVRHRNVLIGGLSSMFYSTYQKIRAEHPGEGLFPVPVRSLDSKIYQPDTGWLSDFEKEPGYKILLCHHPEYYTQYLQGRRFDLILSGHAHGGQWRFYSPFRKTWQGIFAPGQGFFPALTYGIHDDRLIVSRGLSNPTLVPRISNPEEVVYIGNNRVFAGRRVKKPSLAYA